MTSTAVIHAILDEIDRAEAAALALHERDQCYASEWSCSHCEREQA